MTLFTLVRHGETDWNLERRIQGSSDVPLNATGREQALTAAAELVGWCAADAPTVVVASDLSRAAETARIIADALRLPPPRLSAQLRERAYGAAEGVLAAEVPERFGGWDGGGIPGCETREELRRRAVCGLRRLAREVRRATAPSPARIIAVTHGGVITELVRHASGDTLPLPGERIANCSLHRFVVERESIRLLSYAAAAAV